MAKKELFHFKLIGNLMGNLGAFPVHRGQLDRKALRQANRILNNGQVLIIFPEGTRSRNGRLKHAFPGAALIALHSGAPILPIGIIGTEKVKGTAWILRRPEVTINIGRPFHLPPVNGKLSRTGLNESTNCIMEHIAELLPVEHRGKYSGRRETGYQ